MQKNANRYIIITLHKTQVQVDHRPQHKTRYTKSNRKESGNCLECVGTGDKLLSRTPVAQALRLTIDKCDLMKQKSFCKAKPTINKTREYVAQAKGENLLGAESSHINHENQYYTHILF